MTDPHLHQVSAIKYMYGKCSKISNTFHFLFSKKKYGLSKLTENACKNNREDADQQSDLGFRCLSRPFWLAISVQNFRVITVDYTCFV